MTWRWKVGAGLAVVALPLLVGWLQGSVALSTDARRAEASFYRIEQRLGRRLYAPTWLPAGMEPVAESSRIGTWRILTSYEDRSTQITLILAQEGRTPDRDRYHRETILPQADLEARVGADPAYFIRDPTGQRRLFWCNNRSWLVVSSYHLRDEELLRVAQSVR